MSNFNWEDFNARVAEYVVGGMDKQSAELQVQYEMADEADEYDDWVQDMELEQDEDYLSKDLTDW